MNISRLLLHAKQLQQLTTSATPHEPRFSDRKNWKRIFRQLSAEAQCIVEGRGCGKSGTRFEWQEEKRLRGGVFCECSAAAAADCVLLLIIIEEMPRQQQLATADVSDRIVCKTWSATRDMWRESRERRAACGNPHPVCATASPELRHPFPYDARGLAHVRAKCYNDAFHEENETLQKRGGGKTKPQPESVFTPTLQPASPFAGSSPRQPARRCQQPAVYEFNKRRPTCESCDDGGTCRFNPTPPARVLRSIKQHEGEVLKPGDAN